MRGTWSNRRAVAGALLVLALVPPGGPRAAASTAGGCADTVFADFTPPPESDDDASPVEVGVRLHARRDARLLGLRFFKEPENVGPHMGRLWGTSGDLIREVAFTEETAAGWQEARFEVPVHVAQGTTFVASYHAPRGHYAEERGGLAHGFDRGGAVYAPGDGVLGRNGVFRYGDGGYPTETWEATNYFVDVVVADAASPSPPLALSSPASVPRAVLLSWEAPGAGEDGPANRATEYVVFRNGQEIAAVPSTTTSYTDPSVTPATTYTYRVEARDPCGDISEGGPSVEVTTPPEPETIFGDRTPSNPPSEEGLPVEVGVKFRSDVAGTVDAIRFYRHTQSSQGYVANLWTVGGRLLATGRIIEGQSRVPGYQEVEFAKPVPIAPGETYVASYFTSRGGYAYDPGGLAQAVTSGHLTALDSASAGGNGVYRYAPTSAFPTETFNAANYWVDVRFRMSR